MANRAITPELVIQGRIEVVVERLPGSSLIADAGVGAGELELDNVYDFNEDGGTGQIGDGVNSEPITYTLLSDELGTLTLSGTLENSYLADETFVTADAGGLEKTAYVVRDDVDDEQIEVRIPHRWYDVVPEGVRDPGQGEAITARFDGVDWLLEDILGQTPSADGSYIDSTTLPPPPASDGNPPASSPTAVVSGGIGTLFVTWVAVANADPVQYEVHISTSSGFTPDGTTKAATTGGTLIALHALPDATPLDYATTYYIKIIAVDDDGSASAGAQGSGSPKQVDTPDIAVNAITADTIAANAVTAEKLDAVIALVSTLIAGTVDAARTEVGVNPSDASDTGIRAYDSLGNPTLRVDGQDGSLYMRGRLDWGTMSRLLANDIVEIHKQLTSGFDEPVRVQVGKHSRSGSGSDISSLGVSWPSATTDGATLIAVVAQNNSGGGGTPSVPTMSGWTQVQTQARGGGPIQRLTVFKLVSSGSRSGTESIGLGSNTRYASAQILEYAGTDDVDVIVTPQTGTDHSVEFGSTGTLAQAGEVEVAFVATQEDVVVDVAAWTDGYERIGETYANDGSGTYKCGVGTADRITTDTSDGTTTAALIGLSGAWISSIVTFKAKSAGTVDAPADADILRIYTLDDSGGPVLHVQDSDGDENSLVMAPAGVGWRLRHVTASVDFPNTAAHTAATPQTPTISNLAAGDLCFIIGRDGTGSQTFHAYTEPVCTTPNQITVRGFNTDSAASDPASTTYHFLVVNLT